VAGRKARRLSTPTMEIAVNRILEVTDEDETLVLEYLSLDDLKNERILTDFNFSQGGQR
jgi:hypothetical protein